MVLMSKGQNVAGLIKSLGPNNSQAVWSDVCGRLRDNFIHEVKSIHPFDEVRIF